MANNFKQVENIQIENAQIRFRNFKGEIDKFNPSGRRTFAVLISHEQAVALSEEGWNVKYLKPRDDDEEPQAYLTVEAKFGVAPPTVWLIAGRKRTRLDEETISQLDFAELANVDLVISPYHWEMPGKSGIKAYLKKGYFTVVVDSFDAKYAEMDFDD